MKNHLVTYLIADFDGRGCDRLRTGRYLMSGDIQPEVVLDSLRHGFKDDVGRWVMPGAILSIEFGGGK